MSKAAKTRMLILIFLYVICVVYAGFNEMKKQKAQKENVMLSAEIKSATEKIKIGETEVARLNKEIESQINKANREKQDLNAEIDKAKAKTRDVMSELRDVKDDRDKWQSRVGSIKEERDNLMTTIKSHKAEVDKLSSEIISLKNEKKDLKNEKKDLLKKIAEKPEPQIIYRDRVPDTASSAQTGSAVQPQNATDSTIQQASVANPTPASSQNEEYWAGVLREKVELQMKINDMEKKASENAIEIVDLKQKNDTLKMKIEVLEKDKESIERGIATKESQLQALITEKDNGLKKIVAENSKNMSLKEEMINSLSIQLAKSKNENSVIQQRASGFEQENQDLRRQIEKLVSTKGAIEKSLLKLTQDKKEVEKKLDQSDGLIQSKINEIWSVKESIDKVLNVASKNATEASASNEVELAPIIVSSRGVKATPKTQKVEDVRGTKATTMEREGKILTGNIVSINNANNFVIIDLGLDSGVNKGDAFNVFHNKKYIGRVEVIQVRTDISAADIKDQIAQINIGDIVR